MSLPTLVLVVTFLALLVLNVPVAFCMGIAATLAIVVMGDLPTFVAVAHKIATGIDSFTLLAIPFFILSGLLMGQGGVAKRLIDLADLLVGGFRGGLAFVNVLTCMLFGAISGSAAAAVSSVGSFMVPLMGRYGYEKNFSTSLTITAATTGLLIPPSNVMIVYSLATGGAVSIAAIFMAGVVPGILAGVGLMAVSLIVSIRRGYGGTRSAREVSALTTFWRAIPALLLIVIVLGGILGGVFTATEASAVAVVYSLILAVGVYREVKLAELPKVLLQCGVTTSVVFLLIGTSMAMSWVLAAERIPQEISAGLLAMTDSPILLLIMINLILLAVGTFMDMTPAVLIFTPIFLPIVESFGIHPVHFGIIMIMNLCIGICTPPVGTCLFLGCGIGDTTVSQIIRRLLPFLLAMIVTLLVCTYLEPLSMWLPDVMGLIK